MPRLVATLTLLLAASGSAAQQSLEVTGDLGDMVNAALGERARELWTEREVAVRSLDSAAAIEARQLRVRERVLAALGGFPARTPLNVRITRTLERDGYRVEMLVYESQPGFHVTANVYVPRGHAPPFPAVLGVAGHSVNGKAAATYQRAWIAMAKRGFLVLAFDPPGQGERLQSFDPALGRSRLGVGTPEHDHAGLQCLLTGQHFARYLAWDAIRGLDYLLSRGDVAPARLAVAGNSGGGTQAALLAVVEPRLAAVVSSCYMTSWKQLWFDPGPQDAEQVLPGFLAQGFDFADLALAFAPRPFQILSAVRDYFPIVGARTAHAETRRTFSLLGHPERAGFFEHDDTHGWSKPRREATYRWLERWLHGHEDAGLEPDFDTEHEAELYATPTGQVATSFPDAATVQSLNSDVAERVFARRKAIGLGVDGLRELVRARLRIAAAVAAPTVRESAPLAREGFRIERLAVQPTPGITVPALVFVPAGGPERKSAVLYVHGGGKGADAGPGGDVEALVRAGHVVMTPDPSGMGESRPTSSRGGYDPMWQTLQRALLVERTLVGMQVEDLIGALHVLRARTDVDPDRVAVLGKGHGGLLALVLGALDARLQKVAVEGATLSYMDVARARHHEGLTAAFVPGILQDFDLPDLAAAIAPRPLWIVDPRTPTGAFVPLARARAELAAASDGYARAGRPAALEIRLRPEGWPLERVYAGWLAAN